MCEGYAAEVVGIGLIGWYSTRTNKFIVEILVAIQIGNIWRVPIEAPVDLPPVGEGGLVHCFGGHVGLGVVGESVCRVVIQGRQADVLKSREFARC